MARRGCGCTGYAAAIAVGVVLGLIGLGIAGYAWVSARVLSESPAPAEDPNWTSLNEAKLGLKLAPIILAARDGKALQHSVSLTPEEANRILDLYMLEKRKNMAGELEFGDTALAVKLSRRIDSSRYLNLTARLRIDGNGGNFEVKAYSLKLGDFAWPRSLLPEVAKWIEGMLETNAPLQAQPYRIIGARHDRKGIDVELKTLPGAAKP